MSTLFSLLGGSWNVLAGIGVAVAAVIVSWFGGKRTGKVQEKARSEVKAAKLETAQISAVAEKQAKNSEEAKNVQATNAALTDDDARNKLRQSGFNNQP